MTDTNTGGEEGPVKPENKIPEVESVLKIPEEEQAQQESEILENISDANEPEVPVITEPAQEQIPSEYFRRIDENTQYQLKTTIECEPRIGFSNYLEKLLSPIRTMRVMGTFSRIEIIATCPSSSESGNLIVNAFYGRNKFNKKSYSFGDDYTNVVKLKSEFNILTRKIKKGYPKSCVYFRKIHSREINKTL